MAGVITVAVVDDDRMLRDGIRSWFAGVEELDLVACAATVDELLAGHREPPDVVLLDLMLRDDRTPADNIRRLRTAGSRVLMISVVADRDRIVAAVTDGADGFLTKDQELSVLVEAVREIAAGRTAHSPELAFALAYDRSPARPRLSPQEREVLVGYASGLTLKATARRTGITVNTAKYYLDRVKAKYQEAGRPTYTKIDLATRVREDGWR
ncbi:MULTISPECIES: response regulator transcription factor [unclassified Streptomyces]|uniref:response regulator n=1 Tax=Streptomyces TaxID=1883 RepID=UPI000B500F48|nr:MULTISPECIES: response regulator transcription factor [unclassified Streptomyces]MYX04786.1 response regulator [Streptomyces sp. SID8378]SNB89374.1 two component transcriptional regulator, LuxR family [Streptomyces sp. PgraA7]